MDITQDDIKEAAVEFDPIEIGNLLNFIRFEANTIGEIHSEMDVFFGEMAESQDPKDMGWVGSNGLP